MAANASSGEGQKAAMPASTSEEQKAAMATSTSEGQKAAMPANASANVHEAAPQRADVQEHAATMPHMDARQGAAAIPRAERVRVKKPGGPRSLPADEPFFGHAACAGCAGALAVRHVLKVLGPHAVAALPAGCMSAVGFNFPQMAFTANAAITPFASVAAVASGIEAGLAAQGKKPDDCTVVAIAGDGGTADIGMAALSGAIDRDDDILYVCYDNEAYMNTGIQESSLTPWHATTTTSPAGARSAGTLTDKKRLFEIVAAHGIPYAATASTGYLADFDRKLARAASMHGMRFIHVLAPCPTGWGHAPELACELARQAVDCGLWYLAEYEGASGTTTLTRDPKEFSDVGAYLLAQRRFRHLSDDDITCIECARDVAWARLRNM